MSLTISMDETDLVIEVRLSVIGPLTRDKARALLTLLIEAIIPMLKPEVEG